ncbi:MAG: hypothetical protein PHH98_01960 [Candidatus Gracilibacteria bacterium]|nr:hypothetical protein [Candidatus Gracilibacteria bacterium]
MKTIKSTPESADKSVGQIAREAVKEFFHPLVWLTTTIKNQVKKILK